MAINLQKTEQQLVDEVMGKVNLSKDKEKLQNSVINLSKCVINLSKKSDVDLGSTKAQVVLIMDNSGSMSRRYSNGVVQKIIDRVVPLGLTFDDDGNIVCLQFDHGFKLLNDITLKNYENYVKKEMDGVGGSTKYSSVLKELKRIFFEDGPIEDSKRKQPKKGFFGRLFGKKNTADDQPAAKVNSDKVTSDVNECPVFVMFITDGACDSYDESETNKIVRELSKEMCFIQFIGSTDYSIEDFRYLKELDNLDGRESDNTGFVRFDDIEHMSDSDFYNMMLEQYAHWLKTKGF